jgi:hypothetical protein
MKLKPINIDRDTKLIRRYLNISKPSGVSDIEFELEPTGDDREYYMNIEYVVPDGSKYLLLAYNGNIRFEWNHHITKDIYNFFGLKVIIGVSAIRNEKFNYG